mgnify:CR=1 FL=1
MYPLFKEKREINLRMGILEDLFEFVGKRPKDRTTLQKIVKKLRDKIKKIELDDVTKGIIMGELDWIDKHYRITRKGPGFDESKVGECFEKLEDFVKRNEDILKEGRVADERFKIPFSGKTSGEIRELETREEWLKKSMKEEWLTKEQEEWESKIKNCKDIYSLTRIEKELEREMQKHGGLPGNDYWIYHGTPTYPGLKKLIENKKEELEELLGRAFKSKTIREEEELRRRIEREEKEWQEKAKKRPTHEILEREELKRNYIVWEVSPIEVIKKLEELGYSKDEIKGFLEKWSHEKLNIWEDKIRRCKSPREIEGIKKILKEKFQRLSGLYNVGSLIKDSKILGDYDIFHYNLEKLIEEKSKEFAESELPYEQDISEEEVKAIDRQLLKERIKKVGHGIKYPFVKGKIPTCPRCGSKNIKPPGPGELGVYTCLDCKYKFYRGEEYQPPLKRLFKRGKTKIYEGKPSKNVEEYAKIILPIVAIGIGILILIFWPRLWIIGIPAIIIGIGYLLIVAPEMDKFSFKQKIGVLIIITGGLLAFVFGVIWYGLALLFLGGAFIVYDWIPKGRGRLPIKIIELGATLALLILVVPAFLNWAGISISLGALALFSGLNTFLLFLLWSWSGGKSMKEALEEELLKKQIEEIEARKKAEEAQADNEKKEEKNEKEKSLKTLIKKIKVSREKEEKNDEEGEQK